MKYTLKDLREGKVIIRNNKDSYLRKKLEKIINITFCCTSILSGCEYYYGKQRGKNTYTWFLNEMDNAPCVDTLTFYNDNFDEQGNERKEFVLPDKWYIERTFDNHVIINGWLNIKNTSERGRYMSGNGYIYSEEVELNEPLSRLSMVIRSSFTKITFDQFKQYVLKENTMKLYSTSRAKLLLILQQDSCPEWKQSIKEILTDNWAHTDNETFYIDSVYIEALKSRGTENHKNLAKSIGIILEDDTISSILDGRIHFPNISIIPKGVMITVNSSDKYYDLNSNYTWKLEGNKLIPSPKK